MAGARGSFNLELILLRMILSLEAALDGLVLMRLDAYLLFNLV